MRENLKTALIEEVVRNIREDLIWNDSEAIEELLSSCPVENLIAYLDEKEWGKYSSLVTKKCKNEHRGSDS